MRFSKEEEYLRQKDNKLKKLLKETDILVLNRIKKINLILL